jgi:hypothetical protein
MVTILPTIFTLGFVGGPALRCLVQRRLATEMTERLQKITFGEMRDMGVRGVLIYCADYRCSHSIAISADNWPDDLRLSDIEPRFVCQTCGKRGADERPDFNWDRKPAAVMVYR